MLSFFQKIIDALDKNKIPYMLSGSVAMSLYVVPRATKDFDFIIQLLQKDIDDFVENFGSGYYCDRDAIADAVRHHSLFNIIDHESGFKADFVILSNDDFRQEEFNRRVKLDYFGKDIYVVSAEDLLISKIIWIQEIQSAIQAEDIRNIGAIKTLDWAYINHWISLMKLNTFDLFKS